MARQVDNRQTGAQSVSARRKDCACPAIRHRPRVLRGAPQWQENRRECPRPCLDGLSQARAVFHLRRHPPARIRQERRRGDVGGGWATLGTGVLGGNPYYSQPSLLLQLKVELEDGKHLSVVSDGAWKSAAGPIVTDSVYDGEVYDARLETPGWDRPGFDDSSWTGASVVSGWNGVLSAQMLPPIRVDASMVPVKLLSPKPGVYVYDLGQTISGWAELRVSGPRDTTVTLRFSETVYPDGMINTENLREAKQRDIYVLRGRGEEVYEPHFTYHGFRYVEVTGFPGTPGPDSIRGRVVHT